MSKLRRDPLRPLLQRMWAAGRGAQRLGEEFLREAHDGLFSFVARVWRTLFALLRRPGLLTVEYWEGRRAQYVAPLRLFLFISFVTFFFLTTFSPDAVVGTGDSDGTGMILLTENGETTELQSDAIDWEEDLKDSSGVARWLLLEIGRASCRERV